MQKIRSFSLSLVFLLVAVPTVLAGKGGLKIDHTVAVADIDKQLFHVTTEIKNIDQPTLTLSLPTWTPGWYTVENYYKNVLRFRITDGSGKALPLMMSKKQTWNVDTRGLKEIRVDYDYQASVLALNQARIKSDLAFFTGIELFLEPVGHRDTPATVHFKMPDWWKIISALKETSDPMVFTAADYDTLVDAPTEMGRFDVTKFEVEGKPHYFTAYPAGTFSAEKAARFTEMQAKIARADSTMFGGLPYDKYVSFYFFTSPESNASGALEHLNSYVAFAPAGDVTTPQMIVGTAAHEYFHLWNVKRIRPAEMWPYDYSRENETPLLWVSEGFTNYYGVMSRYRAGIASQENVLEAAASAAARIEGDDARNYISPASASVSTWAGYDTPVAFGISYYTQGQNLAALLDLSIRSDTGGSASLDDVMRALFNDHYKKGRGFTTEDMIQIVNRLTKKDYHDFYRRYVFGTDVPDYDRIFGYAGYRLKRSTAKIPDLGFYGRFRSGGFAVNGVIPDSNAAKAGLKGGDVITKIDGQSIVGFQFDSVIGKSPRLTIDREGKEIELTIAVGSREVADWSLASVPTPTAQQITIREGWLKR